MLDVFERVRELRIKSDFWVYGEVVCGYGSGIFSRVVEVEVRAEWVEIG